MIREKEEWRRSREERGVRTGNAGKRKVGRGTKKKNKEGKGEKIMGRRQRERVVEEGKMMPVKDRGKKEAIT